MLTRGAHLWGKNTSVSVPQLRQWAGQQTPLSAILHLLDKYYQGSIPQWRSNATRAPSSEH
jgi:hypothetical protein